MTKFFFFWRGNTEVFLLSNLVKLSQIYKCNFIFMKPYINILFFERDCKLKKNAHITVL